MKFSSQDIMTIKASLIKILQKLEIIDVILERLDKIEKDVNSLKDSYIKLEYKLDNEITILHLRTQEHTKQLQKHDHVIKGLLPK